VDATRHIDYCLDKASEISLQSIGAAHVSYAKGVKDYALDVDLEIERVIHAYLAKATPGIPILGEESSGNFQSGDLGEEFWVVDPIDGTINYAKGIPLFGVCVALVKNSSAVSAGIIFPSLGEKFMADLGGGAYLNKERIKVSGITDLSKAVVGFGDFAVGEDAEIRNAVRLRVISSLASEVLRVRMFGSAGLQLAWFAAGRTDGSITLSNKAWDVQAGVLIAKESGGLVFDLDGSDHTLYSKYTLATNCALRDDFLAIVNQGGDTVARCDDLRSTYP